VPTTSDLITTRQALEILGRADPSTVSRLVRDRRLAPAAKAPGKRGAFLFARLDVETLAAELNGDGEVA
jgi:hypothetical protein